MVQLISKDKILEGFFYGLVAFGVLVIAGLIYETNYGEASRMPANFSLENSRQAVDRALPGNCVNTRNDTFGDQYVFECRQNLNNYTYISEGRVAYNETGPNRVYVFQ